MGTATFAMREEGDSISGESSISVFTLDLQGYRSGGSDMPDGLPLPNFEKIEPLAADQLENLLGGEACMWTEAADSVTLESRVWPRSGAIAEKLWSSQELTDDASDMYRRLLVLDELLETLGLRHRSYREVLVLHRVEERYRKPLNDLIEVLKEDLLFNRMTIYDPPFDVDTPLNRVVDGAAPESYAALRFENKVDAWIESKEATLEDEIRDQLRAWASIYAELEPAFDAYPFLQEVQPHAEHLSGLAELALLVLDEPGRSSPSASGRGALIQDARQAHGGTLLCVVDGLERLIERSDDE